jgi:S-adenosylmethionine-diacylgycerolhomoserine-N-methlytransferase
MTGHVTSAGAHASAMDRMYRLTRHVYDATRKYYLLGRDAMIDGLAPPSGGTVLEMGCGTARNLIAVARRHPAARIAGFDISEEMLKSAHASVTRAGLTERIRLTQGDATGFDPRPAFGVDAFDRVYFSYTLSMIPDWRAALACASGLTTPAGSLHVVDFGDCERLPAGVKRALERWLTAFHVTPRGDMERMLADLAEAGGRRLDTARPYRGWAQLHRLG